MKGLILKKICCYIYLVLSIICIVTSIKLFIKNQMVVYVTPKNEAILKEYFEEAKLEDSDSITKVGLGNKTEPGELTVYYSSGENFNVNITGDSLYSNISKYIRENGYNTGDSSLTIAIFAAIFFIIFIFKIMQLSRNN